MLCIWPHVISSFWLNATNIKAMHEPSRSRIVNAQPPTWIDHVVQLAPLVIGLLAIILTYRYTIAQIRANTVSASRRKWIEELRTAVADLLSTQAYLAGARTATDAELANFLPALKEYTLRLSRCELLLDDPPDSDQCGLRELLRAAGESCMSRIEDLDGDEFKNLRRQILEKATQLVQAEWAKIKRFE